MSARHERHECDTNDTSATQVRRECYTNDTSAGRVKNFDFDNDSSENIFSHSYINYITMKDYKERNNFILRTTFWKCLLPMPFEKCTTKAISKGYTSDFSCKCPRTFPHSYS